MKRCYVAGAYSSNNVLGVLDNIRKGLRASTVKLLEGYAPFCPWMDFHFQLMLQGDEKLTVPDYYAYSMAWLEVSDVVFVLKDWELSQGTCAEIKRATELNIPVIFEQDGRTIAETLGEDWGKK